MRTSCKILCKHFHNSKIAFYSSSTEHWQRQSLVTVSMIFKKYFYQCMLPLLLVTFVHGGKNSDEYNKPDIARVGKTKKAKMGQKTATGTFSNIINQIQNLPTMDLGRRFRTPCKTGNRCGKVIKRLMVPKLAQLENTIMGIMKEIAKLPPGSRLPDKFTKTEPVKLLLDQNYKEEVCMDKLESCLKEDKRRKRILKKLFFKKYNSLRQELIGYGGRRLWGGEGNLFYKK